MKIKKKCEEILNISRIVCEENKRKITFINSLKKDITRVKVDGCQIIDGLKCDFLIKYNDNEHFIELKGSDVKHAIKQLTRTIKELGQNKCKKRTSYVICSRSPLSSPEIQNRRIKFRKNLKSDLIVQKNKLHIKV